MRIALVNDLKIALAALRHIVDSMPEAEIVWCAEDGAEAVERCRQDTPDLILMDMIMPGMDGVEATRRIMQECPCPIVVVTATVDGNADWVYRALGHGALDAVNTPVLGTAGSLAGAEDLIRKIRTVQRLTAPASAPPSRPRAVERPAGAVPRLAPLAAIGSSTGGPKALAEVLSALPNPLPFAVTIVQHIDQAFAVGLGSWLEGETGLPVSIIQSGQRHSAGQVGIAATGAHLILDAAGCYRYVTEPADHIHRPSVDVFFQSLEQAQVSRGAAVLLTGMGRDGAAGLLALRQAGWHTIAQDQATSVVWGMPGAAVQRDAAVQTLAVQDIGPALRRILIPNPLDGRNDS